LPALPVVSVQWVKATVLPPSITTTSEPVEAKVAPVVVTEPPVRVADPPFTRTPASRP
jgi:hypothetical protein